MKTFNAQFSNKESKLSISVSVIRCGKYGNFSRCYSEFEKLAGLTGILRTEGFEIRD